MNKAQVQERYDEMTQGVDPGTEVIYQTYIAGQAEPIAIHGLLGSVEAGIKRDIKTEAAEARAAAKHMATAAVEATLTVPKAITSKLGLIASDMVENVSLKRFDRKHGTDLLGEKIATRENIAIKARRAKIGRHLGWTVVQ